MSEETRAQVHGCKFEGSCCVCDGPADAHKVDGTTLLQNNKEGGRLSTTGLLAVLCEWEGHAYYTIDFASEVLDPFAPDPPE